MVAQDGFHGDSQEGGDGNGGDSLSVVGEIAAEVAHELGNILQVIAGSAYVAHQAVLRGDAAGSLPHVEKVQRTARLAQSLVDDIMALARGDAIPLELVPFADLATLARQDLPQDSARWDDAIVPVDLRIRAHPNLFARLLHALYDNAIHASAPRVPTITTRAHAGAGTVVVEVADDGPGVPAHVAARAFDPLVTARPGGSGLGLALARRIAIAHRGTIALAERGGGALFRVEMPG